MAIPRYADDLMGMRFGRLVVIERAPNDKSLHAYWVCKCDCGNTVTVGARHLKDGGVQSCGCLTSERLSESHTKHGESKTRLFRIWTSMKSRCNSPTNDSYFKYGGRGIKVCQEWMESFEAFRDWALNNGYRDDLSIDRIDNEGNYEPGNCKWSTAKEQANNRRNNKNYWTKRKEAP